jgi:hypothetical protein
MKSLETRRSSFWEILCCVWLLVAQIWYYGQFRGVLRGAGSDIQANMAPLISLGALLGACFFGLIASGIGLQILGWVP